MSKKKDSTLIVKVRTRQSIVLVGLQVQIVSIHSMCVIRILYGSVSDPSGLSLSDVTND